jgi:hypothetical protein
MPGLFALWRGFSALEIILSSVQRIAFEAGLELIALFQV